jgi:hypothetical protein
VEKRFQRARDVGGFVGLIIAFRTKGKSFPVIGISLAALGKRTYSKEAKMKISKLILNVLVVATFLNLAACRRGNDQQGGTGSAPQQSGGSSAPSRGGGQ